MVDGTAAALDADPRAARARACGATSRAPTCSTPARTSTRSTRRADGGHIAVGAIEPQFYAELLRLLELDPADFPQWDRARWPELKAALRGGLRHAHARRVGGAARARRGVRDRGARAARGAGPPAQRRARHVRRDRRARPARAGAALLAARPARSRARPPTPGADTDAALGDWGIGDLARLRRAGAISGPA